jgi:GNAT superfamily N-acetyltransferase
VAAIEIRTMTSLTDDDITALSEILIGVVAAGASVGWIQPPTIDEANAYWAGVIKPGNVLLCAFDGDRIVATGQLELAQRANGRHRAEVNKVLVQPSRQGKGLGRQMMIALETAARAEGRTLLHLDTNADDTTNAFYQRIGWSVAGTIPDWARSGTDDALHGTTFYYKQLV